VFYAMTVGLVHTKHDVRSLAVDEVMCVHAKEA